MQPKPDVDAYRRPRIGLPAWLIARSASALSARSPPPTASLRRPRSASLVADAGPGR